MASTQKMGLRRRRDALIAELDRLDDEHAPKATEFQIVLIGLQSGRTVNPPLTWSVQRTFLRTKRNELEAQLDKFDDERALKAAELQDVLAALQLGQPLNALPRNALPYNALSHNALAHNALGLTEMATQSIAAAPQEEDSTPGVLASKKGRGRHNIKSVNQQPKHLKPIHPNFPSIVYLDATKLGQADMDVEYSAWYSLHCTHCGSNATQLPRQGATVVFIQGVQGFRHHHFAECPGDIELVGSRPLMHTYDDLIATEVDQVEDVAKLRRGEPVPGLTDQVFLNHAPWDMQDGDEIVKVWEQSGITLMRREAR